MAQELKKRSEMDPKYQWRLTDIYADDAAFEADFQAVARMVKDFAAFEGKVQDDPRAAIRAYFAIDRKMDKLYGYASMKHDEDSGNDAYQAAYSRTRSLYVQAMSTAAFMEPELLAMPEESLRALIEDADFADYSVYLSSLLRQKPHCLDAAQEQLLAAAGEVLGGPHDIFNMFDSVDVPFPEVTDEDGHKIRLTHANYGALIRSHNRAVRREAYEAMMGTFGKFGVLSFNGNKMITTSGGGALICNDAESKSQVMWYATQARDSYPYYQHTAIGYNYRMSNVCAGIGRGQMTVLEDHIAHHKHVQQLYKELLKGVEGITLHEAPNADYDSNFWLCTIVLDDNLKVKGQENAYKEVVKTAVGGAAGVIHVVDSPTTDCQPNENVEAMRVFMLSKKIEARPVWKPMHKQPVYLDAPAYVNGVSEAIFKIGMCLPAGPMVSDDDVRYIVECIKEAIEY